MALELEFWAADGPNGEMCEFAIRVKAWEILPKVERYRRPDTVCISLKHTTRQRGEWMIWVRPGYNSGTHPAVGPLRVYP